MADIKQNTAVKPQAAGAFDGDQYQSDLNPDAMAGQNIGAAGAHPEKGTRTVHDVKELHARFSEWSDGDLKQIPVVPEGSRLEQNATYIDLMAATPHEFTATGSMEAGAVLECSSILMGRRGCGGGRRSRQRGGGSMTP